MSKLQKITQQWKQGQTLIAFMSLRMMGEGFTMVGPLVIASRLSPDLFGSYALAKMVVFLFVALLVAPCQTPFIVLAHQEKERDGTMNKTASVHLVFLAVGIALFALAISALSGPIAVFAKIQPRDLLFLAAGFFGLALKTSLSNIFLATDRRLTSSLADLTFGSSYLVSIVVLSLLGRVNLPNVFAAYFLAGLLTAAAFGPRVDFHALRPLVLDRACLREMLAFTGWLFLGVTSVYLVNWGDNLVLRYFVSMREIGVYNLAYQIFKGILGLTFALNAYFLPFVSQHIGHRQNMRQYIVDKRLKIVALGLLGLGALWLVSPNLILLVFGESYRGSIPILQLLLVSSALTLYAVFYDPILNALKAYRAAQTINLLQVVLNLLLDVILVPSLGVSGAAVATVIAYFCRTVALEIYVRRRLKMTLGLA